MKQEETPNAQDDRACKRDADARTGVGLQIALAEGGFTTRVHDLGPYFGR